MTAAAPEALCPAEAAGWLRAHGGVLVSESTVRRGLAKAPQDGRGRVLSGPWTGAYRRGTRWRVPLATLRAQTGQQELGRVEAQVVDLARRLRQVEDALARMGSAASGIGREGVAP